MFLSFLSKTVRKLKEDRRGVTSIEYAIISVAVATIVGTVFTNDSYLKASLSDTMSTIASAINDADGKKDNDE